MNHAHLLTTDSYDDVGTLLEAIHNAVGGYDQAHVWAEVPNTVKAVVYTTLSREWVYKALCHECNEHLIARIETLF